MTTEKNNERNAAIEELREMLSPGDTVYTILRHVSRSGMFRGLDVFVIRNDEPLRITYRVAEAIDYSYSDKLDALTVGGAGMDVGFAVVYALGATLWPTGTPKPHGTRNGEPDSDGGYALRHRWL